MTRHAVVIGAMTLAFATSACSEETQERAVEAAQATGATVESAANDAVRTAERASETGAGQAVAAAIETVDVKAALMADKRVDASGINVDTDHKTKTVTLKGYVPSTDQRMTAEEIAREKAPGYAINNVLVVKEPQKK
jgi:osmotically-inducible protein OsmY